MARTERELKKKKEEEEEEEKKKRRRKHRSLGIVEASLHLPSHSLFQSCRTPLEKKMKQIPKMKIQPDELVKRRKTLIV
jgi:hypothetical protein